MLAESSVTEISLNELSRRVGLAKSNVLRYFESREAVFLELLDTGWREWLDAVGPLLREPAARSDDPYAECARVGTAVADSLVARPLLCELISVTAGVLERNISVEVAVRFKRRFAANTADLARLVGERLPGIGEAGATHFAGAAFVVVAGLWPFANPTAAVTAAMEQIAHGEAHPSFAQALRDGLVAHLTGVLVRSQSGWDWGQIASR